MELVTVSWIVTLLAIFTLFGVPSKYKSYVAAFAVLINSVLFSWLAFPAFSGNVVHYLIFTGSFPGEVAIHIDALSAWFILIVNFTSVTGAFFGSGYLKAYQNPDNKLTLHWLMFMFFHLAMVWVCMLQNGFAFLVAWEIMSLSSMLLVIFDHHKAKTLKAGINYLVQMHISVAFLTAGFIWVYSVTGSFSFEAVKQFFETENNLWLFLIFFTGFGLKAGFIPLHTWLPHAHPAAPSHVSGVMSGVIVKMGIYGIFRIIFQLSHDFTLLGQIVLSLSVLTGIYGILNASVHRDFKRMLAYCTIENIGIIGIGIGIGLVGMGTGSSVMYFLGFGGALLHVLNHSLFKSLLFYSAGSVYRQCHTRNMEQLGGLLKNMPRTAALFLIGSLAIGGLPPFNGFVSEFIIFAGLLAGVDSGSISQTILFVLAMAGLSLVGGLSLLTFSKSFGVIFLGQARRKPDHAPVEVPLSMLWPQYLVVALMLTIAFVPGFFFNPVLEILKLKSGTGIEIPFFEKYTSLIGDIGLYSLLLIIVVGMIWLLRSLVMKNKVVRVDATWGCGYVAANSRQQYTGKSFSKPLAKIFNFLVPEKKRYNELQKGEIFPSARQYSSHYQDLVERIIIGPVSRRLLYASNYFSFIQNGRIQSYVLYGILFILLIFVLSMFNIVS